MKHFCSIPIDLKIIEGGPEYIRCGEDAVYKVKNSDWYVCENHVDYATKQKWELEELNSN